jgi:hypothetical protein
MKPAGVDYNSEISVTCDQPPKGLILPLVGSRPHALNSSSVALARLRSHYSKLS